MLENETYFQIGQILKNSRVKKKITIEKISAKTRISIQNLNNIENGDFHLLAGKFYQRSFIKSYCTALRISEKKILLMLDNASHKSDVKNEFNEKNENQIEKTRTSLITEKIPTIPLIIFASLGLIAVSLFSFYQNIEQDKEEKMAVIAPKPDKQLSKIDENIDVQKEEYVTIEESATIKEVRVDNVDDIQNYQIQNNKNNVRQIIAKNDVWIEIKDSNRNILISTVLKKDEFFKLPNNNSEVIISTGNAGAIFLKDENNNSTDLGTSGDILNSVQLNSLITNH